MMFRGRQEVGDVGKGYEECEWEKVVVMVTATDGLDVHDEHRDNWKMGR